MELLVKKQKNGSAIGKEMGILSINRTSISVSERTIDTFGLKQHIYLGIGKKEDGSLVSIFSKNPNSGFNKLVNYGRSKSLTMPLLGKNRKNIARYKGDYYIRAKIDILEGCECYILRPKLN